MFTVDGLPLLLNLFTPFGLFVRHEIQNGRRALPVALQVARDGLAEDTLLRGIVQLHLLIHKTLMLCRMSTDICCCACCGGRSCRC